MPAQVARATTIFLLLHCCHDRRLRRKTPFTHNPPNAKPKKKKKKKRDREGRQGVVQTGIASFIGPSSNLVKKPIQNVDKLFLCYPKKFPLLTFSPFIYTNKNLLHPVLKCLSIYSFAPRAFEKEQQKTRTGGAPKMKEKLGNLKRRRRGGRREPETKGSVRCLRRRAPKQALYKHLQRVPHHS